MKVFTSTTLNGPRLSIWAFTILVIICCQLSGLAQDSNDCEGAIVICDDGAVQYTPMGPGMTDFNNSTCGTTEHQSIWLYIEFSANMPPNQELIFTIAPLSGTTDWDFAMWGPDVDCSNLDAAGMIRCNFSYIGTTGLSYTPGGAFEQHLVVQPGEGYYIMVDNFSTNTTGFSLDWGGSAAPYLNCDANPNCELEAQANPNITICDGEEFNLSVTIDGGMGTETVSWSANPPVATQYIVDTNAMSTSVTIPPGLGSEFEFVVVVRNDSCTASSTTVVSIAPLALPTFTLETELCGNDGVVILPLTSNEGIPGTWNPSEIDPTAHTGNIRALFTPDGAECADTTSYLFNVSTPIDPVFSVPDSLCESDGIFILPTQSENGLDGIWSPAQIDPSLEAGTTVELEFEVTDEGCFNTYTTTIHISLGTEPSFAYDHTICESDGAVILDNVSLDGHIGTWNPGIIDPTGNAGGIIEATFYPDPTPSACLIPYTHQWEVLSEIIPDFSVFDDLCSSDPVFVLPTMSNNGIGGNWDPSSIDPAMATGSVLATFTPNASAIPCVGNYEAIINIDESTEPVFDDFVLCELDAPFALPTISNNGILGSWTPTVINPANAAGNTINATFTPDANECADVITVDIAISLEDVPTFSLPDWLCESDSPIDLPVVSDNGIPGTWSSSMIDPTGQGGGSAVAVFTPDISIFPCTQPLIVSIPVLTLSTPEFILPEVVCASADPIVLPSISVNGISGTWSIPELDPMNTTDTFQSQFVADGQTCVAPFDLEVVVIQEPNITAVHADAPSDCGVNDGTIRVETSEQVEYSIDGGNTWMATGEFSGLQGGNYTILLRSATLPTCISSIDTALISPGAPLITATTATSVSNCRASDGTISIEADGNNLEYSIDGGATWQSSSSFTGLSPASYEIRVRETGSINCQTSDLAIIEAPEPVTIDSIRAVDQFDCSANDGQLIVYTANQNVEYSIDGGVTWQNTSLFSGLQAGNYTVHLRNMDYTACRDSLTIDVRAAEPVSIDSIAVTDLSDCAIFDGSIAIQSSVDDIEYSIDGGITWQSEPLFEGLAAGSYPVQIRKIGTQNCVDESMITINAPNAPILDELLITPLTDCHVTDGTITLITQGQDLEYSIDGGTTWQASSSFTNLDFGNYTIIVRPSAFTSCEVTVQAEIPQLLPPQITEVQALAVTDCESANGMILISATGDDLEFSIDDGVTWSSDSLFTGLSAGEYDVVIRNVVYPACTDNRIATISDIMPPTISSIEIVPLTDCNSGDASIEIYASGEGLEYSIDNGGSWQMSNVFSDIQHGDYAVIVRLIDHPNCLDQALITIENPACDCEITVEADVQHVLCHGDATGAIELVLSSISDNHAIRWNTNDTTLDISNLEAGSYTYQLEYNDNCIEEGAITITEPAPILFELSSTPASCDANADGTISILNHQGGSGIVNFFIDNASAPQNGFNQLLPGEYMVTAQDSNGCRQIQTITVDELAPPTVSISGETSYLEGDSLLLVGQYDGVVIDSLRWLFGNDMIGSEERIIANANASGEYTFEIFFGNCSEEVTTSILVERPNYYFPSAFSPNDDGINDRFYGQANLQLSEVTYDLQIFNRWGGMVFSSINLSMNQSHDGWNGYQNGKPSDPGIYLYKAIVKTGQRQLLQSGEITLIR